MAAPRSVPPLSPAELQGLVARAGLELNPGQLADLVLVWRQLSGLVGQLPRERALRDDLAFAFRLTPPPADATSMAGKPPRRAAPPKPAPRAAKAAPPRSAKPRAAAARVRKKR